jgi:phage internal scaffolding protein
MKPPFIRSPYNYDTKQASDETAYKETMPSLTVQSQAIDTDINEIVRRVGIGAPMPTNLRIPTYGDFTEIKDYRTALEAIGNAQADFLQLPAATRAKFQNDPQQFLDYCNEPGHEAEMTEMGLLVPQPAPQGAPGAAIATPPAPTGTPLSTKPPGGT